MFCTYVTMRGASIKTMTYSESRARYSEVLDQVVNDREEIIITRQCHESAVIMALDE